MVIVVSSHTFLNHTSAFFSLNTPYSGNWISQLNITNLPPKDLTQGVKTLPTIFFMIRISFILHLTPSLTFSSPVSQ